MDLLEMNGDDRDFCALRDLISYTFPYPNHENLTTTARYLHPDSNLMAEMGEEL